MCICIFPRSNSHSNICILLKSVAHACVDCTQLLIFPKPWCYYKLTYLQPISQAEVYQRLKNTACQHNKAFISLSFHPLPHKNGPKEPLGIAILTVLFFCGPAAALMLQRLLSVCHVGSSKNKSSSWQNECWGVCLANSEKQKIATL